MKKLSKREKVLLVILVLFLAGFGYFKLVHEPVSNGIQQAEERRSAAETQVLIEAGRLRQMTQMEQEIEALFAEKGEDFFDLPAYDNMQHVMIQLNTILSASQEYSLTFGELRFDDHGLVSRPIQMEFTTENYERAHAILEQLYGCVFRCRISDIDMTAGRGDVADEPVTTSLTVTYFEQTAP